MLGCVVGTLGIVALVGVARRHHVAHRFGCGGYGRDAGCAPWGRARGPWAGGPGPFAWRGGWGGGWSRGLGVRALLHELSARLDATPAQEKVLAQALRELADAARSARGELGRSRGELARALGGDQLDVEALGELFARHDELLETLRKAATGALARVHDALDEQQRARLADLVAHGPRGGREGACDAA